MNSRQDKKNANLKSLSVSNSHLEEKYIRQIIRLDGFSVSSVKTANDVFAALEAWKSELG